MDPPDAVRMSSNVRRSLRQVAADWSSNGLESGGFLFGTIEVDCFGTGTRVKILEFSRPRLADDRKRTRLIPSPGHIDDAFEGRLSQWPCIGLWHTHPNGCLQPSRNDLLSWGGGADRTSWKAGRPPGYIGLILGAAPGKEWLHWGVRMAAWFVPPLRWDGVSTEPRPIPIKED